MLLGSISLDHCITAVLPLLGKIGLSHLGAAHIFTSRATFTLPPAWILRYWEMSDTLLCQLAHRIGLSGHMFFDVVGQIAAHPIVEGCIFFEHGMHARC